MPPAASISRKRFQAACAILRVRSSRYQLPPAGSMTDPMRLSWRRISWVLAATRHPKALDAAPALTASKGRTVIALTPPLAAPKVAVVARSMFTHGSTALSIAVAVTAWSRIGGPSPPVSPPTPQVPSTRAQHLRSARHLAVTRNASGPADSVKPSRRPAASGSSPGPSASSQITRSHATPVASIAASSVASHAPASAKTEPSASSGTAPGERCATSTALRAALHIEVVSSALSPEAARRQPLAAAAIGSRPSHEFRPARSTL